MTLKRGNNPLTLPVYTENDDITGTIALSFTDADKYEHMGLKCFLIGYLCKWRFS